MYADDLTLVANLGSVCFNNVLNIDININNELASLSDWLKLIIMLSLKTKFNAISHSTIGTQNE